MLKAATLLQKLERVRSVYGGDASSTKLQLLEALRRRRLPTAGQVLRFHEALCFLRAYPDDPQVLATVEELLHGFARRGDLTRQRRALADSGLAGTEINFSFCRRSRCASSSSLLRSSTSCSRCARSSTSSCVTEPD